MIMKGRTVLLESVMVFLASVYFQIGHQCVIEDEPALPLAYRGQTKVLIEEKRPAELKQNIESWQRNELMRFLSDEVSECPNGRRWYTRSQSCVPQNCPGGSKNRDVETGLCIRKPRNNFKPFRKFQPPSLSRSLPVRQRLRSSYTSKIVRNRMRG